MSEFVVYFVQPAGTNGIVVEADDAEEAIELAYDKLPSVSLCHQCAREVELAGEWEPETVTGADGRVVWMAAKP